MKEIKKMTFGELEALFIRHEATHPKEHLTAHIVYKEESWNRPYPLESRTYVVSSCNRAFEPGKISNSIFADCLDGSEFGVRLDWYKKDWIVDYCYLV